MRCPVCYNPPEQATVLRHITTERLRPHTYLCEESAWIQVAGVLFIGHMAEMFSFSGPPCPEHYLRVHTRTLDQCWDVLRAVPPRATESEISNSLLTHY